LLVATPWLGDPNFDRTVVLLLDHTPEGSLGVVLNRPSPLTVMETVPDWAPWISQPDVVFVGGPVSPSNVVALGRRNPERPAPEEGWAELPLGLGALDLNGDPALLGDQLSALRLFAGYAGWGGGQLLAEIGEGAWWVFALTEDDCFTGDPEDLWHAVLGRQAAPWRAYGLTDDPAEN
jgi:putative transcriptional regulator